jgi:hypothetical protein
MIVENNPQLSLAKLTGNPKLIEDAMSYAAGAAISSPEYLLFLRKNNLKL